MLVAPSLPFEAVYKRGEAADIDDQEGWDIAEIIAAARRGR